MAHLHSRLLAPRHSIRPLKPTSELRPLLIVLALGLVARVALILPGFGTLGDPDNYLPLARSLARGQGFRLEDGSPTAYRPPLYPILLAPMVATLGERLLPWGIAVLHVGLGLGTVALTYLTARRWGYGPRRALVAAAIVALDPVAVVQARAVMTETLAAFLVAVCLAATTVPGRIGFGLGGLAFGISSLCRPSLLPGAGLCAVAILAVGPGGWRRRWIGFTLFSAGLIAPMIPWAIRNARLFGEPVFTTTHGGYTLALANNPAYYADVVDGPLGAVWTGPNQRAWFEEITRATAGMTQPEADRHLRDQGLRMLRERPGTFFRASLARLGRFWGLAPSGAVYPWWLRLATAVWTIPLWIALVGGLFRRAQWRWPSITGPLVMIGLTAVHSTYWTDLRMRVPLIAAIALTAAGVSRDRPKAIEGRPESSPGDG
jgi:hypothetical protein